MFSLVILVVGLLLQAPPPQAPAKPRPPAAADTCQEAFIIEQYVTRHRFESDGTGRREARARVKVQSDAGVQAFGQLVFGYSAATEKLDIEYVRVRKADGTTVTAPLDTAVQDLTSPVQQVAPVYTDFRQKHVTVPGLRPGETLEYSVVATIHTPLAPGHFWTEDDFQRDAIVLDEQLEIDVPAGRSVTLKTAADAAPSVSEAAGRTIYKWSSSHTVREPEKDEETLRAEAEAEAENPRRAAVRLTTFPSWDEVGRWYAALEKPSRAVTPEIRKKAEELTAGRKTDIDKLQALYDFVAPDFRYVSISLGMGRYQPRPAADVLRDQYGDCKDKHTLLAALMEAVGLRASSALINSTTKIDPAFPSPSQFDHVITLARVAETDTWMDVTTEVAPFRLLSANLRKKQALVVSAEGSRLVETPAEPPMLNQTSQHVTATLGALGALTGTSKLTVRGDMELMLRTIFHRTPQASWKKVIEQYNEGAGIGGDITDWKISDPKATREPFTVEFTFSKTGFVDWTKKNAAVKLPFSGFGMPEPSDSSTVPIDFGGPTRADYRLDLTLGEGYKGRAPLPVSLKRDYAGYDATYALTGQRFTAHRKMDLTVSSLPSDRISDYRAFRRAIVADNAQTFSVDVPATTSDAPAPDLKASELVRGGSDAIRNRNYAQAVTLLKRAVELEPKNANAWNYLGDSYRMLRQYPEALGAYQKVVEVNPYDEGVHNDIAYTYWTQRRYPEAEAAFRKQLEINPLDKYAHTSLGELLVDMEKYEAAVPQLERAISLNDENSTLQVELGTALLNLSKNDEALAAFTKAVEIAPNPLTWNNVAYQLALKGVHLERALQYADSAVAAAAAASRNFTIDHVSAREISVVSSLGSYWDTLGWVYFAKGDMARAEKLVHASWLLDYESEVGDHLGQIYEKQGRKDDAIRMYALASMADNATKEPGERLVTLAGEAEARKALEKFKHELLAARSVRVQGPKGITGMADFIVLFAEDGSVQGVKFVSGEEKLRRMDAEIRKAPFGMTMPEGAAAKVLRRGTVSCTASECSFVLFPTRHTLPVQ